MSVAISVGLIKRRGGLLQKKTSVLFVCVHNAGRSQMAAGFLKSLGGERVAVRSAGTQPAGSVNPDVVAAMLEVDIDLASANPELLTTSSVVESEYVITMGCGDACPVFPGKVYLDWTLTDPAGKSLDEIRVIRDKIRDHVIELLEKIDKPSTQNRN